MMGIYRVFSPLIEMWKNRALKELLSLVIFLVFSIFYGLNRKFEHQVTSIILHFFSHFTSTLSVTGLYLELIYFKDSFPAAKFHIYMQKRTVSRL